MKIRITENIAGIDFSYSRGQEVDVKKELSDDLVKAGYAEIIKPKSTTAKKNTSKSGE